MFCRPSGAVFGASLIHALSRIGLELRIRESSKVEVCRGVLPDGFPDGQGDFYAKTVRRGLKAASVEIEPDVVRQVEGLFKEVKFVAGDETAFGGHTIGGTSTP